LNNEQTLKNKARNVDQVMLRRLLAGGGGQMKRVKEGECG
jgi:hypothetical protein